MASLFTNVSASSALQTLSQASKSLSTTQNRVSTGYRINTAEDNAAHWSIATTLRADVSALSAVSDPLGLDAAHADEALQMLSHLEAVIGKARDLGSHESYVQNLIDANNRGIGQLVDADLNEESSKLKALQAQEQLAIQALSIANNSTQNVQRLLQ